MSEQKKRILLVDDDENVRTSLAMLLEEENYEIIEAGSVGEARDQIHPDCRFDFAILDRRLGHEEGTDLIPEIRSRCPDAGIFILTGSANAEDLSGADGVIDKVESPSAVLEHVDAFSKRGPQRQS